MFECTARRTPQQNGLVETVFASTLNKSKAMMVDTNLPYKMRCKLFQEAIMMATKINGLSIVIINKEANTRYEHFGNVIPKFVKHLRIWSEARVVKI